MQPMLIDRLEDPEGRVVTQYQAQVVRQVVSEATARQMVTRLGMSEKLGAMTFGRQQSSRFLDGMGMEERTYSEETARAIDAEVKAILLDQHRRATEILTEKRDVLERMTQRLLEVETLDRPEIERIVGSPAGAAVAAAKA